MSIVHPQVGRLQGALGENARDVALIVRGGVHAATRFDHFLRGCSDIADSFLGQLMPNVTIAATPTIAKSPRRRAISIKQAPVRGFCRGSSISVSISSD